jgi:hypothetical protein
MRGLVLFLVVLYSLVKLKKLSRDIFSEAEAGDSGLSPIRMVKLLTLLVSVKTRRTWDSNIVQKLGKSPW